jgi:hypothetical protein
MLGWDQETDLIARWLCQRALFPHLPSRSRCNRRRRALHEALALRRRAILAVLDVAADPQCIIDRLPLPVIQIYHAPAASREWATHGAAFGKCCSQQQTIFGYTVHLLVRVGGVMRDFALAPGQCRRSDHRRRTAPPACPSHDPGGQSLHQCDARNHLASRKRRDTAHGAAPEPAAASGSTAVSAQPGPPAHRNGQQPVSPPVSWRIQSRSLLLGLDRTPADQTHRTYPVCLVESPPRQSNLPSNQAARFPQLAQLPITDLGAEN